MKFVAYYRVSTAKQGRSGLGLEAQRASVLASIKDGRLLAEFTEVESGKRNDRPELGQAIAHARREGATLISLCSTLLEEEGARLKRSRDAIQQQIFEDTPHGCSNLPNQLFA